MRESARPASSPGASASESRPSSAFGRPPREGLAAIRREASRRPSAVASTPITSVSGFRLATARTNSPSPVPKSTCSARYSAARSASHQRSTQCSFLPVTRYMTQDIDIQGISAVGRRRDGGGVPPRERGRHAARARGTPRGPGAGWGVAPRAQPNQRIVSAMTSRARRRSGTAAHPRARIRHSPARGATTR